MPAKQIEMDEEAQVSLMRGIDKVANAVRLTLGPKGRNVILSRKWGAPTITNDGVLIAKEVELPNNFENIGVQIIQEVANKTNETAGDGTTTATVLAQMMIREGMKNVAAGQDPMAMKRGIDKCVASVVAELKKLSIPVEGRERMAQVGSISANETEIGEMLADVLDRVGADGVVTVEESKTDSTEVQFVDGMNFDRGYVSPYFVTNPERMESHIEDPFILVTDKKISSAAQLLPLMEKAVQVTKNIVVIAEDIDNEALAVLVVNKLRGGLNCLAVKAPGFGDRRKQMVADIAILTGAQVLSEDQGRRLESATVADLGRARRVESTKDKTVIIEGRGAPEMIKSREEQIRLQAEEATSPYEKERLEERLARFAGGVAVIKVGATTAPELKERKQRVEDALSATRAAVEEGVVPGGGVALIRCLPALQSLVLPADEAIAKTIVQQAVEDPIRIIASNAGRDGPVLLESVLNSDDPNFGFDAERNELGDLMAKGIIDPAKVCRTALENAGSVAGMILTTRSLITDQKDENEPEHDHVHQI